MTFEEIQPYVIPAAIVGFLGWRYLKFQAVKKRIPQLLAQGAVVVDVRTSAEYQGGARPGSLNIPLDQLSNKLNGLDRTRPVVVCCASGSRSAMAAMVLKKNGFPQVVNAGPWTNTLG